MDARAVGGLTWGLEDVILCFSLGAMVWFVAILPFRSRLQTRIEFRPAVRRLLDIGLPTFFLALPCLALPCLALLIWVLGATTMEVILIVMFITTGILGRLRPDLVRLSANTVVFYTPYYVGLLYLCHLLMPGFFDIWNGPELWGVQLFGVPLDEVVFIVAYTSCFPMIIGIVFDARIHRRAEDVDFQDGHGRRGDVAT